MSPCATSGIVGFALLLVTGTGLAQSRAPVQLAWQAPANCPQAAQVRQKLRDLLGASSGEAAPSRLRAEGQIEPIGDRFRLTLNIHYDQVNGTRVVEARSCEDLGGVAAVTLALLFRAEHSSSSPLTARDLGGATSAAGAEHHAAGTDDRAAGADDRAAGTDEQGADADQRAAGADKQSHATQSAPEQAAPGEQASDSASANPSSWRFAFRVPELRTDVGVLPEPSFGLGLAAGLRHEAWLFLASGTLWLARDYESESFVGYGAHFGRVSGALSGCRGFWVNEVELAPCVLVALDVVSARGTGVGITSTDPRTPWLSIGAGFQGLWHFSRSAALVLGLEARVATSKPRFVSESVGEIARVGPAALGFVLGCEWVL